MFCCGFPSQKTWLLCTSLDFCPLSNTVTIWSLIHKCFDQTEIKIFVPKCLSWSNQQCTLSSLPPRSTHLNGSVSSWIQIRFQLIRGTLVMEGLQICSWLKGTAAETDVAAAAVAAAADAAASAHRLYICWHRSAKMNGNPHSPQTHSEQSYSLLCWSLAPSFVFSLLLCSLHRWLLTVSVFVYTVHSPASHCKSLTLHQAVNLD